MICSLCLRVIAQQSNRNSSKFLYSSRFQPVGQQYRYFYEPPKTAFDSEKKSRRQAEEFENALVKQSHWFEDAGYEEKNKETFQKAIGLFLQRNVHRRGHVEFIYAAMKRMKDYGVHKDLESYKKLIEVFPKGKMIGKNIWQIDFMHYPKHQQCCIDVLDELAYQEVYPDRELYELVKNVFGDWSYAMRKMKRMMYWMPKFRYMNPYPIPYHQKLPKSPLELAKIAISRMCRDPATVLSSWFTEELTDPAVKTWIVSGQSPEQADHISRHDKSRSLYVDGPFDVWVYDKLLTHFNLTADPDPKKVHSDFQKREDDSEESFANWTHKFSAEFPESRKEIIEAPTMHEQIDGTILGICATGTSNKESLVCWMQFLERANPRLSQIPVIFRLSHASADLVPFHEKMKKNEKKIMEMKVNQQ